MRLTLERKVIAPPGSRTGGIQRAPTDLDNWHTAPGSVLGALPPNPRGLSLSGQNRLGERKPPRGQAPAHARQTHPTAREVAPSCQRGNSATTSSLGVRDSARKPLVSKTHKASLGRKRGLQLTDKLQSEWLTCHHQGETDQLLGQLLNPNLQRAIALRRQRSPSWATLTPPLLAGRPWAWGIVGHV